MKIMFGILPTLGILVGVVYLLCVPFFTSWLASQKDRSGILWFFLGLFFGLVALIAVGLSDRDTSAKKIT